MPHVNHRRGETARFVFRREHGRSTRGRCCWKPKGGSEHWYKKWVSRKFRHADKQALALDWEDPFDKRRTLLKLAWVIC